MSRQEDFQEHAEKYANKCGGTTQEKCAIMTDYFAGAEYGYQYAVDKACEWLEQNAYLYVDDIDQLHESALIGDFRKCMEDLLKKGGEQ